MIYRLVLLVLLDGLRRHPQEQYVRTTALSEKWIFCLSEEVRNAGQIPMPTGVGVMSSPGKGCVGPESTTAQYLAYGETTVRPYLCLLYLCPVFLPSTVLPPLDQKGPMCLARTSTGNHDC